MGSDERNAEETWSALRRLVAGQTRKHVATRQGPRLRLSWTSAVLDPTVALSHYPQAEIEGDRGVTRPRTARSPSRHEETNYSGILTPNRCKN